MTIDEYNVVLDGVSLVNDWRKTLSTHVEIRDPGAGQKLITIDFLIEADTEAELAERWEITRREFNRQATEAFGYKTNPADRLFEYKLGDGETLRIDAAVSDVPQDIETAYSKPCALEIAATITGDPTGSTGSVLVPQDEIEGLATSLAVVTTSEAGETPIKVIDGVFTSIARDTTIGPLTIASIADSSGRALVTTTTNISGAPDTAYAAITGTLAYNGRHRVISQPSANSVILDVPFAGAEAAGTMDIGSVALAGELLEDAFETIMERLGVGEENYTLIERHVNEVGDGTVEFMFAAQQQDFVPAGLGDGHTQLVKSVLLRVAEMDDDELYLSDPAYAALGAGSPPRTHAIEGFVTINRLASSGNLHQDWAACEDDILDRAEFVVGQPLTPRSVKLTYDTATPGIGFTIFVYENLNSAIMLDVSIEKSEDEDPFVFNRGDGLHGIQFDDRVPIRVYTRRCMRVGTDEADWDLLPPLTETGFFFHRVSFTDGPDPLPQEGPNRMGTIYTNQRVETWIRLKLEA